MPKRMLWTERIIESFPIWKERGNFASFLTVRLVRSLCFSSIFWLSGFLIYLTSGLTGPATLTGLVTLLVYVSALGFLIFAASGWFHNRWNWFFNWSSGILELSETEFSKFHDRMERFNNSFFPCLIIALVWFITLGIPSFSYMLQLFGPTAFWIWLIFVNLFLTLFYGTGIWIIISMWITFYVTFRQPLNLKLSPQTNEEFRPLAIWSLKVLLLPFMVVTLVAVFWRSGQIFPETWGVTQLMSSLIFIMIMGVLAFLLPFYNVHRVLIKLKKLELQEIEEESNKLMQDLTLTASKDHAFHSEERTTQTMHSLVSLQALQIRERRAKEADEWPIDTTILSILAGIVLIPILTQIIINVFFALFAH